MKGKVLMGFECGFEKLKKAEKDLPFIDAKLALSLDYYENSKQLREYYKNFSEYLDGCSIVGKSKFQINDHPLVEKFKNFYHENKAQDIEYWCSVGRNFDDFVLPHVQQLEDTETYLLDYDTIRKIINDARKKLNDYQFIPVVAIKGTYLDETTQKKCIVDLESVFVQDDEGNLHEISSNSDYLYDGSDLMYTPVFYDVEYINALKEFISTLEDMMNIDFENYYVYYYRSY